MPEPDDSLRGGGFQWHFAATAVVLDLDGWLVASFPQIPISAPGEVITEEVAVFARDLVVFMVLAEEFF